MRTLEIVADQVWQIMAQHVLEGQVGVFLAALYQLICTQQQGITLMVVTQASTPRSQQLGYYGIKDPVIHSSDSGSRFPTRMYSGAAAD